MLHPPTWCHVFCLITAFIWLWLKLTNAFQSTLCTINLIFVLINYFLSDLAVLETYVGRQQNINNKIINRQLIRNNFLFDCLCQFSAVYTVCRLELFNLQTKYTGMQILLVYNLPNLVDCYGSLHFLLCGTISNVPQHINNKTF